ncbi:hypothetical protein C8R47DRAFT_1065448 [Mycena vitilis]|nr:hypothetical protein C8R47DRAFT_1065448 [Mycena vitilis]
MAGNLDPGLERLEALRLASIPLEVFHWPDQAGIPPRSWNSMISNGEQMRGRRTMGARTTESGEHESGERDSESGEEEDRKRRELEERRRLGTASNEGDDDGDDGEKRGRQNTKRLELEEDSSTASNNDDDGGEEDEGEDGGEARRTTATSRRDWSGEENGGENGSGEEEVEGEEREDGMGWVGVADTMGEWRDEFVHSELEKSQCEGEEGGDDGEEDGKHDDGEGEDGGEGEGGDGGDDCEDGSGEEEVNGEDCNMFYRPRPVFKPVARGLRDSEGTTRSTLRRKPRRPSRKRQDVQQIHFTGGAGTKLPGILMLNMRRGVLSNSDLRPAVPTFRRLSYRLTISAEQKKKYAEPKKKVYHRKREIDPPKDAEQRGMRIKILTMRIKILTNRVGSRSKPRKVGVLVRPGWTAVRMIHRRAPIDTAGRRGQPFAVDLLMRRRVYSIQLHPKLGMRLLAARRPRPSVAETADQMSLLPRICHTSILRRRWPTRARTLRLGCGRALDHWLPGFGYAPLLARCLLREKPGPADLTPYMESWRRVS